MVECSRPFLLKLQTYGLCSNSLALLKSYFTNIFYSAQCCGIFIKMICFIKTFDLNWVLTLTTTKYIFRMRRLTMSSAVLRRTGIQLVAGINPTISLVIHRNIKYLLYQEPRRKLRKRCTSMAIQFDRLKRLNYWGDTWCKPIVLGTY